MFWSYHAHVNLHMHSLFFRILPRALGLWESVTRRFMPMMMKFCLMSSDVSWHIRGQVRTNAEARCNNSLRPGKPEGSLGRTAQDGHLDSHTAPELCFMPSQHCSYIRVRARENRAHNYDFKSKTIQKIQAHKTFVTPLLYYIMWDNMRDVLRQLVIVWFTFHQ